jgi:hypothetical protein
VVAVAVAAAAAVAATAGGGRGRGGGGGTMKGGKRLPRTVVVANKQRALRQSVVAGGACDVDSLPKVPKLEAVVRFHSSNSRKHRIAVRAHV